MDENEKQLAAVHRLHEVVEGFAIDMLVIQQCFDDLPQPLSEEVTDLLGATERVLRAIKRAETV